MIQIHFSKRDEIYGVDPNSFEVNGKIPLNFSRLDQAFVQQGQIERKQDNIFERSS